jgi:hypothetical protein
MKTLISATLALAAISVHGQALEKWGYPDPGEFAKATNVLCSEQRDSVILATRLRNEGRERKEVLGLVPPNSSVLKLRVVDVYSENIEDVYAFPDIGMYSMVVFRAEVCRKEVMEARRLARFATVKDKVRVCEEQHGKQQGKDLYACVRTVVEGM